VVSHGVDDEKQKKKAFWQFGFVRVFFGSVLVSGGNTIVCHYYNID
jgi:hypothetical protein